MSHQDGYQLTQIETVTVLLGIDSKRHAWNWKAMLSVESKPSQQIICDSWSPILSTMEGSQRVVTC